MKHLFHITIFLTFNLKGQIARVDTSIYRPLSFKCIEEIDSLYQVDQTHDTSMVLTASQSYRAIEEIFLLTKKANKWSARYFYRNSKRSQFFSETKVASESFEEFWKSLKSDNLIYMPTEVRDSSGEVVDLYVLHGIYYHFRIFTKENLKEYVYQSPETYMKKFPNEIVYNNIVSIIKKIYSFYGATYPYKNLRITKLAKVRQTIGI
jgi:hypothetical protein